jgi:AI-2 transport system permease protein
MNSINTALVFLKVPAYWNNTISGSILLTMVVADALLNRYFANRARGRRLNAKFLRARADEVKEAKDAKEAKEAKEKDVSHA